MSSIPQLIAIVASSLTLFLMIEMLRRGRMKERHALWWLLAGCLALLCSIFPGLFDNFSKSIGFEVPINFVFFITIAVLFLVCIQISSELTSLEEKTRVLAEETALLRHRIELIENSNNQTS